MGKAGKERFTPEDSPPGVSRREFLALLGAGGAATLLASCNVSSSSLFSAISVKPTELTSLSAMALAQAIRDKRVSAEEVVNAYLRRIEDINPKINAIVQLAADAARAQAREADDALARGKVLGPLHGVPFTVTDLLETAGMTSAAGTMGRANFTPTHDATVVARLRAAGAILLGKTNTPELGIGVETDNLVYKWTDNPYDRSRTPGGSGGGEAAIIAASGSPLGLGSEVGGSLCSPCHFCGVAGLRPTHGRISRTGHVPPPTGALEPLWHIGPVARFVADLHLTLPIIVGVDGRDPAVVPMPLEDLKKVDLKRLRVAFYVDNGVLSPTPETVAVIKTAAKVLADAGMVVEEQRPPGLEQAAELFFRLLGADGGASWRTLLEAAGTTELHRSTRQRLAFFQSYALSVNEFANVLSQWKEFQGSMLTFMDAYDAILCPVNAYPAMPHGATFDAEKRHAFSYASAYNLTGWPAVTVRGGVSPEGLPIGVQIVARPWREDVALAVAQQLETSLGGWRPLEL
jgi:amidase